MIGNKITLPTWRWLKINKTEVEFDIDDISYSLVENSKKEISKENKDIIDKYLSGFDENFDINSRFNHSNIIADQNELTTLKYELNKENPILIDKQIIIAEENKEVSVVYDYYDDGNSDYKRYTDLRILAKNNADVRVYIIQRHGKNTKSIHSLTSISLDNANIEVVEIEVGDGDTYFTYRSHLVGSEAKSDINSIYFGVGNEKLDLFYNIDHIGKKTNSNVIVKGALANNAKKVFKASLDFKEGSAGSSGNEEEYVTLMSDTAKSVAVPLLLCHEHDVVGNHASSAGKLDKDVLFYIMSRGISRKEAEKMIIESNLLPIVDLLPIEEYKSLIRDVIERKIDKAYES